MLAPLSPGFVSVPGAFFGEIALVQLTGPCSQTAACAFQTAKRIHLA